MAIADDFSIDANNQIISHDFGSTVYTINELYTFVQDYFDEIILLSSPVPMSAQTPSEYSLINGWYLRENAIPYLNFGALKTIGYDASIYDDGIYIIRLESASYVNCDPSDIGKSVTDGASSGILLDYNNDLRKWWVRRIIGTSWLGTLTVSGGVGSGSYSSSNTGETLFSNIYTLGELEPTTVNSVYIEQTNPEFVNDRIPEFWGDEHIDILVKVKEAGSLINSGNIIVYSREYGNLYTHYKANLSSGGRTAIPLSTSSDSNNNTLIGTVSSWSDVTITFGSITRDIGDGVMVSYDVEIDCGNRATLREVYERLKYASHESYLSFINTKAGCFYRSANDAYRDNIQAPFGSYVGGRFYGARGVWLKNVPYVDLNNYQLLASDNTVKEPKYTSIGVLKFDSDLADIGSNAVYRLFYKQISDAAGSRIFGTHSAVLVNADDNVTQISGNITSNQVQFDYDFDGNTQTGWLPNHTYVVGDEFRNEYVWYHVDVDYISGGTFGANDITNSTVIDGPTVVLVALGLDKAQYVSAVGTISKSTENLITVDAPPELSYVA